MWCRIYAERRLINIGKIGRLSCSIVELFRRPPRKEFPATAAVYKNSSQALDLSDTGCICGFCPCAQIR